MKDDNYQDVAAALAVRLLTSAQKAALRDAHSDHTIMGEDIFVLGSGVPARTRRSLERRGLVLGHKPEKEGGCR